METEGEGEVSRKGGKAGVEVKAMRPLYAAAPRAPPVRLRIWFSTGAFAPVNFLVNLPNSESDLRS